jgi:hypothetical protein
MKMPQLPPDLRIGDLLQGFDKQLLYLLERGYLDGYSSVPPEFAPERPKNFFDQSFHGFHLNRLHSYGERDRDLALQNIENWLGLFRDGSHSFLMSIDARRGKVPQLGFMAGARDHSTLRSGSSYAEFLRHGMAANFPGSDRPDMSRGNYTQFQDWFINQPHAGMITGIPSRKKAEERFFAQGIERFLDSVAGLDFGLLLVAEPYETSELFSFLDPVFNLKNSLGQMRKFTLTDSQSIMESLSHTLSANLSGSKGTTDGTSTTTSHTDTKIGSAGMGGAVGSAIGGIAGTIAGAAGLLTGPFAPIAVPLLSVAGSALGTMIPSLLGGNLTSSDTISKTISEAVNTMTGVSFGYARTKTRALTSSQAVTREAVNYAVEYALEILDLHIARIRAGRNYGYWNTGLYFVANTEEEFLAVRRAAIACFSGEGTHLEPLRFVTLKRPDLASTGQDALMHAVSGHNPSLAVFDEINRSMDIPSHPLGKHMEGIGTPMTTAELGILCAPPQRECRAISVTKRAIFGGKSLDTGLSSNAAQLKLGNILYFGEKTSEVVTIPLNDLTRHALVTGITGSGKTNTVKNFCDQLQDHMIPWLIIEPSAKSEYRNLGGANPPHVFRLGDESEDGPALPFRFNPFYFPKGIGILSHIDRLKAAFNAAFPMYASMPYLLEEAIVQSYEDAGWNLNDTSNSKALNPQNPWASPNHHLLFPTLSELLLNIDGVVASKRYDQRLEMDLSAALRARIGSLLLGAKGLMLNTRQSIDIKNLLRQRVVLEMSSMGSDEEKVLMMGLLTGALFENAQVNGLSDDGSLKHLLVIEEAHRLLRAAPAADNPEISNVRGAAIEQFSNLLAEMRAFGYGVMIVEQSPSKLLPDVVRSTNLKVVHQLAAAEDRHAVGSCMTLDEAQMIDVARLRRDRGETVAYQPEWPQAYCVKVSKREEASHKNKAPDNQARRKATREVFPACSVMGSSLGSKQGNLEIYRALCGMLLGNEEMIRAGTSKSSTKQNPLDVVLKIPKKDTHQQRSSLKEPFEDLLADLMRILPVGLDVFSELPDRVQRVGSNVEELIKIGRSLLKALGTSEALKVSLACLTRRFCESRGFSEVPVRIAREHPPGDECCKALSAFARAQTSEWIGTANILVEHREMMERLLIEQTVRLSGMGRTSEIIERCMQQSSLKNTI